MSILSIVIATFLLAHAQGVPTNCATNYQKLLQDLTTLRGSCSGAAFYDCCQVCAAILERLMNSPKLEYRM